MKTIEYLLKFNGKIILLVHKNPDPDCIGSALAFYKFMKNFKSDIKIISKDEPPQDLMRLLLIVFKTLIYMS